MSDRKVRFRSDFDGVFNQPELGADAFLQMYSGYIAAAIGLGTKSLNAIFRDARQMITENSEKYGWKINGVLVAPWYADHYQEAKAIADVSLGIIRDKSIPTRNHVPTRKETADFLNEAFQTIHPHIIAPPKQGAKEALDELNAATDFALVSNSETVNVRRGLVNIYNGDEEKAGKIRVIGDAKKQKIDPSYDKIRKSIGVPGLTRRPLLRRRQFLETLKHEEAEAFMEDVAEFLYAPVVAGLFGILLKTSRTRPYEISFFKKHGRGFVANDLEQAVAIVKDLRK